MRKVDKKVIVDCANNLMFNLSEDNIDSLEKDFENFIAQIDYLKAIDDVDLATPMSFPVSFHTKFLREDKPSNPLKVNQVLKNVENKFADQVKVSKVIGE